MRPFWLHIKSYDFSKNELTTKRVFIDSLKKTNNLNYEITYMTDIADDVI